MLRPTRVAADSVSGMRRGEGMDRQEPWVTNDEIREVRQDVEALRQLLGDPVEAARIAYEALLALRQNGKV